MGTFYVQTYANPPLCANGACTATPNGVVSVYDVTLNPQPDRKLFILNCTRGNVSLVLGHNLLLSTEVCFSLECFERTSYQYPASPISFCLNCRRVTYKYKPTWKYFVGKLLLLRCYLMKAKSCARSVLESHFTPCP